MGVYVAAFLAVAVRDDDASDDASHLDSEESQKTQKTCNPKWEQPNAANFVNDCCTKEYDMCCASEFYAILTKMFSDAKQEGDEFDFILRWHDVDTDKEKMKDGELCKAQKPVENYLTGVSLELRKMSS